MTHGKTYNKSPRRINHKATKSKTNTGTIAIIIDRSRPPIPRESEREQKHLQPERITYQSDIYIKSYNFILINISNVLKNQNFQ